MHDRSKWTIGTTGDHVIKGRTYKNLTEFSRPCAACAKPFSIFVTSRIASGFADSNSFGLKNCPEHRRNSAASGVDVEALRMANNVMKQELEGLYARDTGLFAENQALKARLATYELQPAMAAVADPYSQLGLGPREKPGTATAQNKLPWE